jgi:hypothetical protein
MRAGQDGPHLVLPGAVLLQKFCLNRVSRKPPSLTVALNCGIGSSSLKADVKVFDRLHMVRDRNSSYCG